MKLSIKALIDFFDSRGSEKGDATALIAMLGEELNAAVYRHFRNNKVEVLNIPVVPGTNKGHRLDRWIYDLENNILFQSEIKNWSASAIDGKELVFDASDAQIRSVVKHYWDAEVRKNFSKEKEQPNRVTKVLLKMKVPEGYDGAKVEPLLIYWMPVSPDQENLSPFSTISLSTFQLPIQTEFSELHIFSVSLYLRQLCKSQENIDLDLPHLERRIKILSSLQILEKAL